MLYFDLMSIYNEEVSLETVIPDHFPVLERFGCRVSNWELFCMDDPAPEIVCAPAEREPRLRVVLIKTSPEAVYGLR